MDPLLPEILDEQLNHFITSLKNYNAKHPHPRSEKDYAYLHSFFKDFIKDQNKRALEVESEAYRHVADSIMQQFPAKTMFNLCVDGRVLTILAFGSPALVGSSMRVPGGILREFIRGKDGKLKLKPNSNYANLLVKVFGLYNTDVIVEVYDCHLSCAARLSEEQAKGRTPEDAGLYADVSHKKQISQASKAFIKDYFEGKKQVMPIQTSFDPHTGYLYMGLETDVAMQYGYSQGRKFTPDVLQYLIQEGKIISTEEIANEQSVEDMLAEYYFQFDWKHDYLRTAQKFWEAIGHLKILLSPILEEKILAIYPNLKGTKKEKKLEREERILLLLSNMLSGYLHNHSEGKREDGVIASHIHAVHYPYGTHEETSVLVSEGGYRPTEMSYFVVFSLDEKNLASNFELSAALVRNNRREKRVKDPYTIFSSSQEFVEASVPVIVQEIVRDPLTNAQWEILSHISWNDLPENWEELSDLEFLTYLQSKRGMIVGVMMGINNLRKRMALLYDASNPTSSHLVEHYKVALPMITNGYRKNEFIVPFVKLGFS